MTLVAVSGPLLTTLMLQTKLLPGTYGPGMLEAVIFRSAVPPTGLTVVKFRLQPPTIEPESPGESSNTYNAHVPFGDMPLKVPRDATYGPAGAGLGKGAAKVFSVGR